MEVSYYPGCTIESSAREYGESVAAVARILDIDLKELADWTCCGAASAHATDDGLALALPARNLETADKTGLDLVVPCAACYSRLKHADKALRSGERIEGAGNGYKGDFNIKHLVDFIWEEVGEKTILEKVKKPLEDLKAVGYYGCLITRPPRITGASDPDNPESMDNILKTLGVDVKNWSYKTDCCGAEHVLTMPEVAWRMIQKLFDMAEEAEADAIVVACPMCQSNLDTHQAEISAQAGKRYNVPILYFTELMGLAFGDPSAEKWFARHFVDPRPLLKEKGLL
ncbi:MAG TPA: CoB--CoM heterodisulfide reductase iron-sulfur subunit B family protein [Dehalococcoidales bacterium]|nr:CoB--CoM heterodisulfide reductase iron-sulfur subunit B family protein [Dehalococcoidales bacterium]